MSILRPSASLYCIVLLSLLLAACGQSATAQTAASIPDGEIEDRVDEIFALARTKYLKAATTLDTTDGLPRNAWDDGSWRQVGKTDWTVGFFPGILWQIYRHDQDPEVLAAAATWTETLRENQTYNRNHDIGFIMYSSFGNALELTGDTATYLQPLLTAARTGAGRFDERVGTIKSWDRADSNYMTIIDNMMNLHLFHFAAEQTGDSSLLTMIRSHADRTNAEHFRPDGSSYHVVDYDPAGNGVQRKHTHQGAADDSQWARGQAWAIYGFLEAYQDLGDPAYLDRAVMSADYFIERLPLDTVPYWDFDAPGIPNEEKDASASAVAASAMIQLSEATGDPKYRTEAIRQLTALSSPKYLAGADDKMGALLRHQTGNKPRSGTDRERELDVNINYGDYYYLEALNRLRERPSTTGGTNIRLAKANGDGSFTEVPEGTRDPDHLGQRIPFVYQMEGPAWENENVGFRLYFDERNAIDIFGKLGKDMVLDRVGTETLGKDQNYHNLSDWGMDILKVGTSLGAGSIGLMIDGQAYHLGDAAEEHVRVLEETPERSSFLLRYRGWEVAGRTLDLDWEISIAPGTWGYTSSVTFTGLKGDEELLTGIVNLHSDTVYTEQTNGRTVMYTYGPQAELNKLLGMAITTDQANVLGTGEFLTDDTPISSTYYARLRLTDGQPTTYRFTAGWEPSNADFATREGFVKAIY